MNVSRGKVPDYLGMMLDFTIPGEVVVSMINYVKNVLHHAPDDMKGESITPAASYLFQINEKLTYLDDERKAVFVTLVMQCLYLSQRARPDIRTAVLFLSGCLQRPDEDDYCLLAKLRCDRRKSIDHEAFCLACTFLQSSAAFVEV
jgi:hypothetical protein